MNKTLVYGGILIAIVIAVGAYFVPQTAAPEFGATGTRFPNGLSADSTSPSAGQVRGTTLTVTSNSAFGSTSATSTTNLNFFCYQYYATSSATAWKLTPKLNGLTAATSSPFTSEFGTCS